VHVTAAGWSLTIGVILAGYSSWISSRAPCAHTQSGSKSHRLVGVLHRGGAALRCGAGRPGRLGIRRGVLRRLHRGEEPVGRQPLRVHHHVHLRRPREHQHKVLTFGIIIALVLRAVFIAVGATLLSLFSFMFLLFGLLLLWTAVQLYRHRDEDPDINDNVLVRGTRRVLPVSDIYDGGRLISRVSGKRVVTPLFVVLIAIGGTDILFALDSIPAVFGVTEEAYIVFTANAFALLGLRALYFLVTGLLDRLVYLSSGLALILAFIGVKLILHWGHGLSDRVPEISTPVSLTVIIGVLAVTTIASLIKTRRDPTARAHAGTVVGSAAVPPTIPASATEPATGRHSKSAPRGHHHGAAASSTGLQRDAQRQPVDRSCCYGLALARWLNALMMLSGGPAAMRTSPWSRSRSGSGSRMMFLRRMTARTQVPGGARCSASRSVDPAYADPATTGTPTTERLGCSRSRRWSTMKVGWSRSAS
jgi:tellurite resistance protein TerC